MMMDQGTFLHSKPINEIVMGSIGAEYVARVWRYLEHLECKVTYLRDQKQYRITFPAGTTEHICAGQSTQWTHRTIICLPGGQRLTKYVFASLPYVDRSTTMLAFPNDVLFGPEPQQM
jgi:hypothetical protein